MLAQIGYDKNGRECAEWHICKKEHCNCVGSWCTGNPERVVYWEKEADTYEEYVNNDYKRNLYFRKVNR